MADKGILLRTLNEAPGTGPLPDDYQTYVENPAGKSFRSPVGRLPGAGAGTPGSGAVAYDDFIFTAETGGPQSFPLPAGTLGLVGVPSWFQPDKDNPDTGQTSDLANYDFLDGNLVVYAATDVKAGDKFFGQRYYAGASGGPSGPISFDDITGTADVSQLPVADAAYIQQLYDALKPLINQDFVPR